MHIHSIFFLLVGVCFSQEIGLQDRAAPSTCTTTAVPTPTTGTLCNATGSLKAPALIKQSTATNQTTCRDICLQDKNCKSFNYVTRTRVCKTFKKTVTGQGYTSAKTGPSFWDRACYSVTCCPTSKTICGSKCVNLKTDSQNCGVCNKKCLGGVCSSGVCLCPDGLHMCDGACVDTKSSIDHCGGCGNKCEEGLVCRDGQCACKSGEEMCQDGQCTDTTEDPKNCGGCLGKGGTLCPDGATCEDGECVCPKGTLYCNGMCITLGSNDHCSACGDSCSPGYFCNGGKCKCYDPKTTDCGYCADLLTDRYSCGKCNTQCFGTSFCKNATCTCTDPNESYCDKVGCRNLKSDGSHCGTCGNQCKSGQLCKNGQCSCPEGWTMCSGECKRLDDDDENCGVCGNKCPIGDSNSNPDPDTKEFAQTCKAGKCECIDTDQYFPGVLKKCGEKCVNIWGSKHNCGDCGSECSDIKSCDRGKCVCPYSRPFECGGRCTSRQTNVNCGTCGNTCSDNSFCDGRGSCIPCGSYNPDPTKDCEGIDRTTP